MTRSLRLSHLVCAMIVAITASACDRDAAPDPPLRDAQAVVSVVAKSDTGVARTYAITFTDDGQRYTVGSFRVAIPFDSTKLRFVGTVGGDSLILAANPVGGRLLVAGATTRGFRAGEWVSVRFAARAVTDPPIALGVEILDLNDAQGADMRAHVKAAAAR